MPSTMVAKQNHWSFVIDVFMFLVMLCSIDILIYKIICICTVI